MSNAQHSSKQPNYRTPSDIVERVRRVLGRIDFDPFTDVVAQATVQAKYYFTAGALETQWPRPGYPVTVLMNPPGGSGRPKKAWAKLLEYRAAGVLEAAVVCHFSIEQLQQFQLVKGVTGPTEFPICIPRRRVSWVDPRTGLPDPQPTHSCAFTLVTGTSAPVEAFVREFSNLGAIVQPWR